MIHFYVFYAFKNLIFVTLKRTYFVYVSKHSDVKILVLRYVLSLFLILVGKKIFESCIVNEQCNGTDNSENCTEDGNGRVCFCQERYLVFQERCIKGMHSWCHFFPLKRYINLIGHVLDMLCN